ncbi:lipopolysaccharide biosynthesis protein [Cohnella sp. GCM10027633]|uniref:lipopolysaccharide biosynthesis protein n=1 Tax=unclassified Cohnella TaxID=2636738 RepID=UPI00364132E9
MERIRKGIIHSLSGDFLSKIPMYLAELILASALNTRTYGLWTSLQAGLRFLLYAHLGLLSAYNKVAPLQHQSHKKEGEKLNNVVQSYMLILGGTFLLIIALIALISVRKPVGSFGWEQWLAFGVIGFLIQSYSYHQARLKNETNYFRMSMGLLIYSFSYLIFVYLLASKWQLTGALVAILIAYLLSTLYYQFRRKIQLDFDITVLKRLLVSGALPFFFTIVNFLLQMTDRIVIMIGANIEMLALYGFAYLANQVVLLMVNAIDRVFSTFSLRMQGSGDYDQAASLSLHSMWITAIGAAIAFGGYYFFGDLLIHSYFSKYAEAIQPIFYMMIGVYFFSSVQPTFSFIMGHNGEKRLIAIHIIMIIVMAGFTGSALLIDHAFLSFSKAVFAAQLLYYFALLYLFISYYLKHSSFKQKAKHWLRLATMISSPLVVTLILTAGFNSVRISGHEIVISIISFLLYAVLFGFFIWKGYRLFHRIVNVKYENR